MKLRPMIAIAFALNLLIGTAASVAQTNNSAIPQKPHVMMFLATYQG
jgi:hypothetical protein